VSYPNVAITYYALTRDYMNRLEANLGVPVENLVVSAIRGHGTLDILRQMVIATYDTIYLPCPSRDWAPFLPMLQVLAQLPRSNRVVLIGDGFQQRELGLPGSIIAALQLMVRAVSASIGLLLSPRRLRRLLSLPRLDVELAGDGDEVLYLKTNLWTGVMAGGSVSHTAGVIQGLTANGYGVTFVSPSEAPELADIDNVSIHRVPLPYGYTYPREANNHRYNNTLGAWVRHYTRRRPAFIYHRMSLGSTAAVDLSRQLRVPLVLEYNGSEVWIADHWGTRLKSRAVAELSEQSCLHHAHLVVTVSEPLRRDLIARGIEAERIVVHPNGFDPARFDPSCFDASSRAATRTSLGIPPDAVVATFVGTFGPWHGAEILASALLQLARDSSEWLTRSHLHILFIGDGIGRPAVEQMLEQAGLSRFASFSGLVAPHEAPAMLAASDFFVAPHVPNNDGSEFFGSPTKLFEYMGMGRPTLASALGQIADVLAGSPHVRDVGHEDCPAGPDAVGVLVRPGDIGELAAALRVLVDHPQWRASAGANARQRALSRFTWSHHVQAFLAQLKQSIAIVAPTPAKARRHKVLINAVHAKSGGGITYLVNILPRLAAHPDLDIELAIQSDQEEAFRTLAGGLPVHILPSVSRLATVFWQEQVDIPRLAQRIGARAIYSPANYGPIRGRGNVLLLRNAFEVGTMDRRFDKQLYWLAVKLTTELSFRGAERAIAVSRHAASNFLEAFGMEGDSRLDVVHHGVSSLFHPPLNDDGRVRHRLLAVSDIYVQKNLETLLRAVVALVDSFPEVTLQIAGRPLDPGYFRVLQNLAAELGVSDKVTFLGGCSQAEVAVLYREADVFVFPSLVETFGNPLLEAMSSGAPVVCSQAAALPEVAGPAALYARPGDPAHMALCIAQLFDDRALWRRHSGLGIERAKRFTWDRCAEATARVLLDVARR
jgi:glycosyltransferase involved in cell wall biosynthesis